MEKAELKVILYVMRRTFGFGKTGDRISLSQMCKGIVLKDGKVLDKGTGLSRDAVSRAISALEGKALLKINRDGLVNYYALNMTSPTVGLVLPSDSTSPTVRPELVLPSDSQKKEKESIQKKDTSSASFEAFWEAYPKKLDRKACTLLWKNRKLERYLDEILAFLMKAKKTESWTKEDGRFIPYPKTFLNGEKWTDDLKGYGRRTITESGEDVLNY